MLSVKEIRTITDPALSELGLREQEVELYCLALALGPVSTRVLAQHLGIPSPNVYKIIAELESHRLTTFSQQKKYGRRLTVVPPTTISELLEKKRASIADLRTQFADHLPELLANYDQGDTPTKIRILQGSEQYRRTMEQMFDDVQQELLFFGSVKDFISILPAMQFADLTKSRVARGIHLKSLMLPSKEAQQLQKNVSKELREIRLLDPKRVFTTSFQLSQRRAIVWQPNVPLALLIEDTFIVEMLRSMFWMIWDTRKTHSTFS